VLLVCDNGICIHDQCATNFVSTDFSDYLGARKKIAVAGYALVGSITHVGSVNHYLPFLVFATERSLFIIFLLLVLVCVSKAFVSAA
jgi:hypothetical protein